MKHFFRNGGKLTSTSEIQSNPRTLFLQTSALDNQKKCSRRKTVCGVGGGGERETLKMEQVSSYKIKHCFNSA